MLLPALLQVQTYYLRANGHPVKALAGHAGEFAGGVPVRRCVVVRCGEGTASAGTAMRGGAVR